ncbi:hypothetical protein A8926_2229 [Saccharopolyspora spinosa]|uniref:Uncharacterized protein n=1 Tax=Saccharopolyspora spinosa TaxID=60894 RepID=A0A2N3XVG2_SACSN|nr:hypothetical protein A8926_2229 [Saccharopolyspora spinosa]
MFKYRSTVPCRDRSSRDSEIELAHTEHAVVVRIADVERLLDWSQAEQLHRALGGQIAGLQSARRKAVQA